MPPPQAGKERKPWVFPVVVTVIAVIIAVAIAAVVIFALGGFSQRGPGEFVSITRSPQNPFPWEDVTVTIELRNATECGIQLQEFFVDRGGASMSEGGIGVQTCEFDIGSFADGTEVWYVATLTDYDGNIVLSQDYTFQVGDVERSQISSLSISGVYHEPQNPTLSDYSVQVFAEIASNETITYMEIAHMIYTPNYAIGHGNGLMETLSGNISAGQIYYGYATSHYSHSPGITIYYRIAAKDASRNTALSEVYSFTIS
jgi:hypothetical protein